MVAMSEIPSRLKIYDSGLVATNVPHLTSDTRLPSLLYTSIAIAGYLPPVRSAQQTHQPIYVQLHDH
jgi:hypothetical protein